jgi:hypothetical protein
MTKYGAIPTEVDGIRFASKAEARRYAELKLMESAGVIDRLTLQPRYKLVVDGELIGTYVADFRYLDLEHERFVVEDVKGVETPVFKLKRKLVKALHGIDIRIVSA